MEGEVRRITVLFSIGAVLLMTAPALQADFTTVSPGEFHRAEGNYEVVQGSGFMYVRATFTSGSLWAGVNLPDEAVIKNVRMTCYDNNNLLNLGFKLFRVNIFTGDWDEIFGLTTGFLSTDIRVLVDSTCSPAPSYRKVYNNALNYYIRIDFDGPSADLRVYGITIEYEMP